MRRKTTKAMAALLGATLIASAFTGCGQDAQQQTSQETKTETKQESQAGEAKASESEEKQETAKWSGTITLSPYMFGPVENDKITPLIEEKLKEYGYDVKFENIYVETGQYAELVNLRLASGEAPDIFRVTDVDTYMGYCKQGLVATWDEALFREHAPDVAAFIDKGEPDGSNAMFAETAWEMAKYNGEMAVVPIYAKNAGSLINVVYNKQWLDKLDAKVPETLDEFVELMYRFKNEDPDGNGKDDTYGFSNSMLNIIFGAYGSFPGFLHLDGEDYGQWYDVDGKLVGADVMPGNEEA